MGLLEQMRGRRAYLDTNLFIYVVEANPRYLPALRPVFSAIDRADQAAVTSALTLLEVLVAPLRAQNRRLVAQYRTHLRSYGSFECAPITRAILEQAAAIRAHRGGKTPDALHVATAEAHACEVLVTNDRRFRTLTRLPVVVVDDVLG